AGFFFQAEDGIRDRTVTGVQTCALPIYRVSPGALGAFGCVVFGLGGLLLAGSVGQHPSYAADFLPGWMVAGVGIGFAFPTIVARSEERRVGKECRVPGGADE